MSKRILIAEDDVSSREALFKLAKLQGYDVIAVANGSDLLTVINGTEIDVVITDISMPYVNGASASEIMKFKGDKTPVIAVTGLSHHEISHVKNAFTMIYYKPINSNELFGYIKTLLIEVELR